LLAALLWRLPPGFVCRRPTPLDFFDGDLHVGQVFIRGGFGRQTGTIGGSRADEARLPAERIEARRLELGLATHLAALERRLKAQLRFARASSSKRHCRWQTRSTTLEAFPARSSSGKRKRSPRRWSMLISKARSAPAMPCVLKACSTWPSERSPGSPGCVRSARSEVPACRRQAPRA